MSEQEQAAKAMDMVKAVYEDQCAEINGREYYFTKTTHKTRRKIFSFYSSVQDQLKNGNFDFLENRPDYEGIERLMFGMITFDGMQLTKCDGHWEDDKYANDYLKLLGIAFPVICYPFMRAENGG